MKLLRTEMMEKKNVSEVSREGHMDARERLIKELEHSARRSQQVCNCSSTTLDLDPINDEAENSLRRGLIQRQRRRGSTVRIGSIRLVGVMFDAANLDQTRNN